MKRLRVVGFATMFLPLALFAVGRVWSFDWLLPLCFFAGFPLLRPLLGSIRESVRDWTFFEEQVLTWMPRIYVIAFVVTMGWAVSCLVAVRAESFSSVIGFPISLLVMSGLASCVSHDLGHRSSRWDRAGANLIVAIAGYPFFVYEHLAHHADPRATALGNCPRIGESVWTYGWRRWWLVPTQALTVSNRLMRNTGRAIVDDLRVWVIVTGLCCAIFWVAGGLYGLLCYVVMTIGVPFLLNTVTYLQHWGLGDDNLDLPSTTEQIGWDDSTRLQSWLILGISFHDEHHREPGRAYYAYGPSGTAPTLPAEYALMVLACFVPSLWRRIMRSRLQEWIVNAGVARSSSIKAVHSAN